MERVGVIGLGTMGGPMAAHVAAEGHEVVGYDERPSRADPLEGVTAAASPAELAADADVLVLSLPGPDDVRSVVDDLAEDLRPGSVLIDATTSTPRTTAEVADHLADRDVAVLGAPVSGGADGAEAGTLTAMVGGDQAMLERCRNVLEAFASTVIHVGPDPGHGHAVKLLNNYLSITAMVATSEAVVLGESIGLDVETMCAAFNASSGRNSATEEKFPEAVAAGEDVDFALGLVEKDVRLLSEFATNEELALLLADVVRSEAGRTRARFGGDGDMTDVYDYVREATGAADPGQ